MNTISIIACIRESHFAVGELRKSQEKIIEWAKEIGIAQMITASRVMGTEEAAPRSTSWS